MLLATSGVLDIALRLAHDALIALDKRLRRTASLTPRPILRLMDAFMLAFECDFDLSESIAERTVDVDVTHWIGFVGFTVLVDGLVGIEPDGSFVFFELGICCGYLFRHMVFLWFVGLFYYCLRGKWAAWVE
jgi:hypothetical protein